MARGIREIRARGNCKRERAREELSVRERVGKCEVDGGRRESTMAAQQQQRLGQPNPGLTRSPSPGELTHYRGIN